MGAVALGQEQRANHPVTRDEQKDIGEFIDRVVGGEQPPMDVEADAIIRALFVRKPDAAYRMTMLALALAKSQLAAAAPLDCPRTQPAARQPWISSWFGRRAGRRGSIGS